MLSRKSAEKFLSPDQAAVGNMMESLRSGAAAAAAATILATGGYVVYKDRMRYPRMIRRYSSGNIVAPLAENQYEVAYYKRKLLQNKRPRGLDVCQQHCKKSAINVSGNVYLYSKMHYHEKMYILYIDHWHLYYYVRFP